MQFQHYWREEHAPLVKSVAHLLGMCRYVQSHTISPLELRAIADARNGNLAPFDGVAELWWNSLEEMNVAGTTREGREAGRMLLADEAKFIDLENSVLFFSDEFEVIAPISP